MVHRQRTLNYNADFLKLKVFGRRWYMVTEEQGLNCGIADLLLRICKGQQCR